MGAPKLIFEVVDEGARLRRFRGELDRPRFILAGIGALLEGASQRAFQEEKLGNVKWKTRKDTGMVPNWPAILAHFSEKASAPPARYFGNDDTLTNTGRLRGSIRSRTVGNDMVEVGSNVPYAQALHKGEKTQTALITKALQERMWDWMKKARAKPKRFGQRVEAATKKGPEALAKTQGKIAQETKVADQTKSLGWLLNAKLRGKRLDVKHPARPLVGLPKDTRQEIQKRYKLVVDGRATGGR